MATTMVLAAGRERRGSTETASVASAHVGAACRPQADSPPSSLRWIIHLSVGTIGVVGAVGWAVSLLLVTMPRA